MQPDLADDTRLSAARQSLLSPRLSIASATSLRYMASAMRPDYESPSMLTAASPCRLSSQSFNMRRSRSDSCSPKAVGNAPELELVSDVQHLLSPDKKGKRRCSQSSLLQSVEDVEEDPFLSARGDRTELSPMPTSSSGQEVANGNDVPRSALFQSFTAKSDDATPLKESNKLETKEANQLRLDFDDCSTSSLKEKVTRAAIELRLKEQENEITSLREDHVRRMAAELCLEQQQREMSAFRQGQVRIAAEALLLQERERDLASREKSVVAQEKSLEEEQARFGTERDRYLKLREREQCLGDTLMALEEDRRTFLLSNIAESDKKLGSLESELFEKNQALETNVVALKNRCDQLEAGLVKIAKINSELKKKMSLQERKLSEYEVSQTAFSNRVERNMRLCLSCCFVLLLFAAPTRGFLNQVFKRLSTAWLGFRAQQSGS